MNTPNPLMPQGSLPQPARAKSTVRIAVFTIIAIHAVLFSGLLMQGCKRDEAGPAASATGDAGAGSSELAKLDTNYYAQLPETTTTVASTPATPGPSSAGAGGALQSQPGLQPPPVDAAPLTQPATPVAPAAEGKVYKIAKGDTLEKIARAHNIRLSELRNANPTLDERRMKIGEKIQIPPSTGGSAGIGFSEPTRSDAGAGSAGETHVVKAGETLTKIARQHNVTVKALRAANGLKTDRLNVNQKLKVPSQTSGAAPKSPGEPSAAAQATNPPGSSVVR